MSTRSPSTSHTSSTRLSPRRFVPLLERQVHQRGVQVRQAGRLRRLLRRDGLPGQLSVLHGEQRRRCGEPELPAQIRTPQQLQVDAGRSSRAQHPSAGECARARATRATESKCCAFQFQEFETEKSFDTVQILVGGRTEDKSVNLATLSGKQELSNKLFVSASNFMIVKFSTDSSVEKKGFRASWKTEPQKCGGNLQATPQAQVLTSPGYPQNYPGGLECLYIIRAQPGHIMSLEVRASHFPLESV